MQPLSDAQRALVEANMWLVKCIAGARALGLPPSVERADVEQAGYLGLIAAAQRYEAGSAASFVTFARFRVNGAITDYLRQLDSVSKNHRQKIKAEEAEEIVEVSLEALRGAHSTAETPEDASMALEFSQQLRSLVESLDGRERTIIQQYYFQGNNMDEIAQALGVGTPRVSQLHTRIVRRMAQTPGFVFRRQAFRFALTSGILRRLGSAALGLFAAFVLAAGLQAQTRVTTPALAGTPGPNPRVWVVMPNGTLSEAELENIQLVVSNGKPILRATVAQPTVVKIKHVVQRENGTDYALTGVLDTVHRNGLLQAEGEDYTIVTDGSGVKTLRFNANAVPQVGDILQIRELR